MDFPSKLSRNLDVNSKIYSPTPDPSTNQPAQPTTAEPAQLLLKGTVQQQTPCTKLPVKSTTVKKDMEERPTDHSTVVFRCAANPTAKSYEDKPLAKRYREKYPLHTGPPKLKLQIIDRGTSLVNRKIKEAKFLVKNKPTLNDKSELNNLMQFLVEW